MHSDSQNIEYANLSILMVKDVKGSGVEELEDLLMPAGVLHQVHQGSVSGHAPITR